MPGRLARAIEHTWQDVGYAVRQLRRAPGFVAAASLTLALGIGANTAVFSVFNGFLRPLPVPDAGSIVVLAAVLPGDETGLRYRFSYAAVQDYRQGATAFADIFAFDLRINGLGVGNTTTQFVTQAVTGNFFSGLRLTPVAGRFFEPGEGEHANAEALIVLGHSYWMRRFGGDPAVVGLPVRLDGMAGRVIGVAPEGFRGLFEGADMDGYIPLGASRYPSNRSGTFFTDRSFRQLTMVARLKPNVTLEAARASASAVAADLADRYPATERGTTVRVLPEHLARPVPLPSLTQLMPLIRWLLSALASLVLLIACLNVANLLLVRATVREREMAVRSALGAGRRRLVRLLLVESVLLALVGAALGLGLGKAISVAFLNSIHIGTDVPLRLDFDFDWRVFGFAFAVAIGTGLAIGVWPALRASRVAVGGLLHDGGRSGSAGAGRQRVRSLLVISQIAGSLTLLVVAGLLVRSLQQAQRIDLGFDPDQVLTVRLDPLQIGYDESRAWTFYDDLHRRLRALPGVESVSSSFNIPLSYIFGAYVVRAEGEPAVNEPRSAIGDNSVTPDYFRTLRIPIVRGRSFTDADLGDSTRVVIVNETFAARFWPNQDPIGKRIEVPDIPGPLWQVIGVARDSKYLAVFESPLPHFYFTQAQHMSFLRTVIVRSSLPLEELSGRVQREIQALDPDLPVADLRPFRDVLGGNIGFVLFRIGAMQGSAMSVLGLILAVIGVYGVVSYRTAQRSREIGIRMALGAVPADIRRLVLSQGAGLVLAGVAAGLVAALALTRLLARVVLFVSLADPLTFAAVTILLGGSALVACWLPARRAMRVAPVDALRHDS